VQIAYRGKRHRFPLETANAEAAAEKARSIYLSLVANGWDGALVQFKPQAVQQFKPATLGALLFPARDIGTNGIVEDYSQQNFHLYPPHIAQVLSPNHPDHAFYSAWTRTKAATTNP
jgi:hypothetical protein